MITQKIIIEDYIKVFEFCLNQIQEQPRCYGICHFIGQYKWKFESNNNHFHVDGLIKFLELYKPEQTNGSYYFTFNQDGMNKRINLLKRIIKDLNEYLQL